MEALVTATASATVADHRTRWPEVQKVEQVVVADDMGGG
ncbi:hypothetical protein ES332_A03G202000v1 [Gossypium tomentosum]|uniref:Uncharacterized protein n=1 Tax=Gossypium tomentosum TaxID=34277 RepID=A0A5D2RCI1_GOSTO|nr:hypothetical protein ES332_A03G202000v1 [Gossypium tomentosum]